MGDDVRVTVIAAGFDRWDDGRPVERPSPAAAREAGDEVTGEVPIADVFADGDEDLDFGDDEFDVPDFLK